MNGMVLDMPRPKATFQDVDPLAISVARQSRKRPDRKMNGENATRRSFGPTNAALTSLRSGACAGAIELRLAQVGLTAFPDEIFGLAGTLEILDLSGNALSALPHDLGKLKNLKVLFCSGNRFDVLPPVLGDCGVFSQVGFRGNCLRTISPESLPPNLRWLTVTDNQLENLPSEIGLSNKLQKLMLAGNRLKTLPENLQECTNLELLRLSANDLPGPPGWLINLPKLAWLAWAGRPHGRRRATAAPQIFWSEIKVQSRLGEGASGEIFHVVHQPTSKVMALKLSKGTITSDGFPDNELEACLAAGSHPNLTGAIGRLVGHPEGLEGLFMPLILNTWTNLAGPPSLQSCSRDVYGDNQRYDLSVAVRIALSVGRAAKHLHIQGLLHGDLYGHNTLWDGGVGHAVLSDFGAASFLTALTKDFEKTDVLAWGILFGELLSRCRETSSALLDLQQDCLNADARARPTMDDALHRLLQVE